MVVNLLSKRVTKAVLLEFNVYNFSKAANSKQELAESEANAKLYLKRLYSKLLNRTFLKVKNIKLIIIKKILFNFIIKKPSLIFSTLISEHPKPQQKLLNYLLFGHFFYESTKRETDSARKSLMTSKADTSFGNELEMLNQEPEEVTFSKIIVQSLKLFAKLDKTELILEIVIKTVIYKKKTLNFLFIFF